jgi:hypothetical protein
MVTVLFTVSVLVPLIVSKAGPEEPVVKAIVLQFALTFTVTVTPLLMITASDEVGTDDPPQVEVLFQLPETEAVRVAPIALPIMKSMTVRCSTTSLKAVFFSMEV